MKRIILVLALFPSLAFAANVQFGLTATTHGTNSAIGTSTIGNLGGSSKYLTYFAQPGDVLDSIWIYASSATTGEIQVLLYTLNSTTETGDALIFQDTISGITGAGDYGIDVNVALTAKTWYALAACTTTSSTAPLIYQAGTAIGFTRQSGDRETKPGQAPSPWGTAGSEVSTAIEMWGAVTQASVSTGRNQVSFVSKRDTVHLTAQTTIVIGAPASMADGDVLIACLVKGDGWDTGKWTTVPTGWVALHMSSHTTAGNDQCTWVGYKIITNAAGEGSSYSWSLGESEESSGGIMCFRGVDTAALMDVSPLTRFQSTTSASTSKPDCPPLTTLADSAMIIVFGTYGADTSSTITQPTGFTKAWNQRSTTLIQFAGSAAAYKMQAAKGATGALTWTRNHTQSATFSELTFALRPAETPAAGGQTQIIIIGAVPEPVGPPKFNRMSDIWSER